MSKKIKLSKAHREVILAYGNGRIAESIDREEESKHLTILLEGVNAAIRMKYPEADMVILRKYELTRVDRCIKLQFPSGRVDGINFKSDAEVVDMPCSRGCGYGRGDVHAVPETIETAFDAFAKLKSANDEIKRMKESEFYSFVGACLYLDEVAEVIALPDEICQQLGQRSNALVAVTPDTVKSLKATFKIAG